MLLAVLTFLGVFGQTADRAFIPSHKTDPSSGNWNLRVFRLADMAVAWVDARG